MSDSKHVLFRYILMCCLTWFLPNAGENREPLSWDLRVHIALDVARGLEYLHDGVIKSHFTWELLSVLSIV